MLGRRRLAGTASSPVAHRVTAATWGWGILAACVAALVYWPWFAFVQSHGGYAALLAHQRGYLGGFASWPGQLAVQLAQARMLSGGAFWILAAALAAGAAIVLIGFNSDKKGHRSEIILLITLAVAALRVTPDLAWWVPLFWLPLLLRARKTVLSQPVVLVYSAWLILALLTPFYHPYARLWLPLQAFECVFLAGLIAGVHSAIEASNTTAVEQSNPLATRPSWLFYAFKLVISVAFSFHFLMSFHPWSRQQPGALPQNAMLPGLLAPTDPLKTATASIAHDLPTTVKTLRVLVRPPVSFYLSQTAKVPIETQAGLSGLLKPADAATWALFDTAIIRQDEDRSVERNRSSADWVLVHAIPTPLSLPVLLDIDPAVASNWKAGVQVELRLMRPKRAGELP